MDKTSYSGGSKNTRADSAILPKLVDKSPKTVQKVFADGAYDRSSCRKYLFDKGLDVCIPTRRDGKIREEVGLKSRNDSLQIIRNQGNDEKAFSRLKRHFGERLSNKKKSNLEAEVASRCHVLNLMKMA